VCLSAEKPGEQASAALQADPLQCNGGRASYDVTYDVEFVLLAAQRAAGGYVTGGLKRQAELQAAGLAETWLETQLAIIAQFGSPQTGPNEEPNLAAQPRLRLSSSFSHLQLRLKQQLLRSKDGNGICLCRDSDVESPVSQAE
jgi:hypothetical protein